MLTFNSQNGVLDVPLRTDDHGVVRVGGTRVSLSSIITEFHCGATPEQIVQDYDVISLEDAYAVVAYYLKNRAFVDAILEAERKEGERIQKEVEARFPPSGIRARLLARKNAQNETD